MTHQVILFSKSNCNYCAKAKAVFERVGINYQEYDVTANQRNGDASIYLSGAATVPQFSSVIIISMVLKI